MSEDVGLPAVVEDVPLPAAPEPDPGSMFVNLPFVKHEASGRITEYGQMPLGGIEALRAVGQLILADASGHPDTDWVDDGVVVPRPALELPASLEVEAGVEVTIEGVPACLIRFTGPLSGEQEHEDGDLEIGFTIPGTYSLKGEAFPTRPFEITLEVTA